MTTVAAPISTSIPKQAAGPRLWARLSVRDGTTIQASAVVAGAALLVGASRTSGPLAVALMALGLTSIYLCSHAIAHVAVGRLVGIRFRAYGVRGTDHPENYPPGIRQLMSALPMWSALTEKNSMRQAGRWAKAAMFCAGETSTAIASIAVGAYAWSAGLPGGHTVFNVLVVWTVTSCITVALIPKGDYAKAMRALGWRKALTSSTGSADAGLAK